MKEAANEVYNNVKNNLEIKYEVPIDTGSDAKGDPIINTVTVNPETKVIDVIMALAQNNYPKLNPADMKLYMNNRPLSDELFIGPTWEKYGKQKINLSFEHRYLSLEDPQKSLVDTISVPPSLRWDDLWKNVKIVSQREGPFTLYDSKGNVVASSDKINNRQPYFYFGSLGWPELILSY